MIDGREDFEMQRTRRAFIGAVGALAVGSAGLYGTADLSARPSVAWDTSWIERVRRARHRALFDAPTPGIVLDMATRWLNGVEAVFGPERGRVGGVLNFRTRAVSLGLADSIWERYAIGEDVKINDPTTGTFARRNLDWRAPDRPNSMVEGLDIERLQARGLVVLVCDFALGHLATRLAAQERAEPAQVRADLRSRLVPGAVLVPSGIWGSAQAQNAGCALVVT